MQSKIKKSKVLIIYPPNQLMDVETPRPDGSLGPLYLAAELEKRGITVIPCSGFIRVKRA